MIHFQIETAEDTKSLTPAEYHVHLYDSINHIDHHMGDEPRFLSLKAAENAARAYMLGHPTFVRAYIRRVELIARIRTYNRLTDN